MFPLKRYAVALPLCALAACGSDRSVNPVAEKVDAENGAGITSANVVSRFDLLVGQRVTIKPRTTTRTSRLRWNSTNTGVASVSSTGTVTANRTGTATVTVSGGWVAENYTVAVTASAVPPAPTVTSFTLQPATGVSLLPGQAQQFAPAATWSDGQQYPLSVTYTATGGTISSTGLFTAGSTAGRYAVVAACVCGLTATATVDVAQLVSLTISPKTVSLAAGATRAFSVSALWGTGATTVPPVSYSATGGSITSTGQYTAPSTAGTYRVIVAHSNGTVRDTATVTVTGGTQPPSSSFTQFLPPGMSLITDSDFGNIRGQAEYNSDGLVAYWDFRQGWDPTAPFSSGVFETFYSGNSAGNGEGGSNLLSQPGQKWRKVYFSIMIWVQPNYSTHSNGEKFFHPAVTTPGQAQQGFFVEWRPIGTDTPNGSTFGFNLVNYAIGATTRYEPSSPNVARVTKGRWTKVEMYLALNSVGNADGIWRVWVDGQVAADRSDVRYSNATAESYFDGIRFTGTRGGGASSSLTPPEGQVRRYDRLAFYASPN